MDQNAFKQLLSAPRPSSSSAAAVLGGGASKRQHDKPAYYKHDPLAPPKEKKQNQHKPKSNFKEGKYKDRARDRRLGKEEDEFAEVVRLNEEFEAKARQDEEQGGMDLESQRAYLGGDAKHSVLVKGLDFALLARNKEELDAQAAAEADLKLEAHFASTSSSQPMHTATKSSGDDLMAKIRAKKLKLSGLASSQTVDLQPKEKLNTKFKPIGWAAEEPKKKKKKKKRVDERGVTEVDGEERRKKIKVEEDPVAATKEEGVAVEAALPAPVEVQPQPPQPTSTAMTNEIESKCERASPISKTLPQPTPSSISPSRPSNPTMYDSASDDDDIFAGVGDYEAPDLDSDSETDTKAAEVKRANWFNDKSPSPIPTTLSQLPAAASSTAYRESSRSPSPPTTTRLVGFASSKLLSASALLAADKARADAAEKKAKKAAWRANQGLSKQVDDYDEDEDDEGTGRSWRGKDKGETDEGKTNREYQQLTAYTNRKAGKGDDDEEGE